MVMPTPALALESANDVFIPGMKVRNGSIPVVRGRGEGDDQVDEGPLEALRVEFLGDAAAVDDGD
jgi:hypothetical protein